jgi:hypothetical protein
LFSLLKAIEEKASVGKKLSIDLPSAEDYTKPHRRHGIIIIQLPLRLAVASSAPHSPRQFLMKFIAFKANTRTCSFSFFRSH